MSARGRAKVRPPRRALTNDTVDFDTTWASLSSSLREIHTKNSSQLSFEQLYRNAYKLVLGKHGEVLYRKVSELEREWLRTHVLPRVTAVLSPSLLLDETQGTENVIEQREAGERLMRTLKAEWSDYIVSMNMTTDVLMYMDRAYCTDNNKPSLFIAAMGLFRDTVIRTPLPGYGNINIGSILCDVMLHQVHLERCGELVDRSLLHSSVNLLEGLYETEDEDESTKLYLTTFEPAFLRASAAFYNLEGKRLLSTVDAGSFCRHTKKRIEEETDRCRRTLSPATLPKIKQVIDKELIKDYMRDVIGLPGSGVKFMLDNERFDELEMIYDLIYRVDPKVQDLKTAVQERIAEQGNEINRNANAPGFGTAEASENTKAENPQTENAQPKKAPLGSIAATQAAAIQWVEDVLQLKDRYDAFLKRAMRADSTMQTAITRTFSDFINAFTRSSEYLSLFFDENLKKGIKGKTENEVDEMIEKGITLLRFISDKDMFELYYKRHLSRRLLMKRSVSSDAERQMISKMKMEVGNTFTQRIEAMFKDMAVSEELVRKYKDYLATLNIEDRPRVDLDVNVLTATMWPLESMNSVQAEDEHQTPVQWPPMVDRVRLSFEKFYHTETTGRRLTWQPTMGTADIRAYFPKCKGERKTRELNVSTYGMVILLLFQDLNPDESLTCEEIQARTQIPMIDLHRNLQSLACVAKNRILLKEPMSKDVNAKDRFSFNESFYSPFQKIKIGVVSSSNRVEDVEERRRTEKRNADARSAIIEAAVVRIMKQRKQLVHTLLVTEVIDQLEKRFKPEVAAVKKRIESLIEREYLERIENADKPSYRYLA